jgi:hypothetical protein
MSSSSKICNFIYSILKEILNDNEGYLFCTELFDSDYSEEDISVFVMRKLLKNIRNNYSFVINEIDNIVVDNTFENNNVVETVVEDNIVIEDNTTVENNIVVENNNVVDTVVENKPKVKKPSKKSQEEEIDYEKFHKHLHNWIYNIMICIENGR